MIKKIIEETFDQVNEKYLEYMNNEEWEKSFDESGKKFPEIIGSMASRAMDDSLIFTKNVLIRLLESEDFKRELFKDMMKQAEEEKKRTGKNPFDL